MKQDIRIRFLRYLKWLLIVGVAAVLMGVGFVFAVKWGFFGPLPTYDQLAKIEQNNASKIMSADGKLLGLYYHQNRTNTKFEEVPQSLINGLIATEDARFYKHNGFDVRAFLRVIVKSVLLSNRSAGGGSTISQQLAKNLFPRKDFGLISMPVVKVKEIITAIRLERIYSKNQILELYLNTVPFGENTFGIETASLTFFNKKPAQLSIQESAVLVGLLKANTGYNPRLNPEAAKDRRNTVIEQMVRYGYLAEEFADSLQQLPVLLQFQKLDHVEGPAPYFREYLRGHAEDILEQVNEKYGTDYNLYTDGLTLKTTLRADLQGFAETSVKQQMAGYQQVFWAQWRNNAPWLKQPKIAQMQIDQSVPYKKMKRRGLSEQAILEKMQVPHKTKIFTWKGEVDTLMSSLDSILYHFGILQCGMMAMDAGNGHILAWVGGAHFKYFKYDHVLSARQVGSTIKPFIYASAIENGVKPCDYYENDSITYTDYDNWVPKNADHRYGGFYSVQGALVNSVNTVSVQLLMETGIAENIVNLQKAGITADLPEVPSLALGTAEIPLFQMVQAYSVFLNKGYPVEPVFLLSISDQTGKIIYEAPGAKPAQPVYAQPTAETMLALLQGVVNRGTASGLRNHYRLTNELGGKTGTTQNQTDGWFMGITPQMVVGVWVGGDSPVVRFKTMGAGQGARTAMPVFAQFIQKTNASTSAREYTRSSFEFYADTLYEFDCADFKENRGFFDFLKKIPDFSVEQNKVEQRSQMTQKADDQTKVGKFLRSIFGNDEKKKRPN